MSDRRRHYCAAGREVKTPSGPRAVVLGCEDREKRGPQGGLMEKHGLVVMMLLAVPLTAAAPPAGVSIWTAAELKAQGEKLAPKMSEKKFASERLGTFGNHLTMIAHREADGEAEIHETQISRGAFGRCGCSAV